MKNLYLLFFFGSLLFSCRDQYEYEYKLICELPAYTAERANLVVTEASGTEITHFDLPTSGSEIRQNFTLQYRKPVDACDVHIVLWINKETTIVYSHLDAKPYGSITFRAQQIVTLPVLTRNIHLQIPYFLGNEGGMLNPHGYTYIDFFNNEEFTKYLFNINGSVHQGLFLEKLKQDTSNWAVTRSFLCFMPDEVPDTLYIKDEDWLQPTKLLPFGKTLSPVSCKKIYVVSPDWKQYILLYDYFSILQEEFDSIIFPENIPPDWKIYVVIADGHNTEHIFSQDEPFDQPKRSIDIVSKSISLQDGLTVKTSGDVDFVLVEKQGKLAENNTQTLHTYWYIQGPPKRFEQYEMPEIEAYFPKKKNQFEALVNAPESYWFKVSAFYSEKLAYDDMVRGFPWKSSDIFLKGKVGYEEVSK